MADFRLRTFLDFGTSETLFYVVPPVGRPPTVLVRYDNYSGDKPILWEQHITGDAPPAWEKVTGPELAERMRASNRRQAEFPEGGHVALDTGLDRIDNTGYVDAPVLRAGNVYRVWLTTDPMAHPGAPGTDLSGMTTVLAAGQRGTVLGAGGVLPDPQLDHLRLEITQTPAPMVYLAELGRGRLRTNQPHGFRSFRDPVGRAIEGVPHRSGSLVFDGLTPGQTYTVVIRVMNSRGVWQEIVREVTLLQRQVDLTVDSVRIVTAGDPSGDAQGYFRVEFFVGRWGDDPLHEIVRSYRFPPAGTGPPWSARIGPEPVSRNEFGVFLEVYDDDPEPFDTDEHGQGYWEPDEFLTPVTDRPFRFATRRSAGGVVAEARGRYSIRHLSPEPPPGPWQSFEVPDGNDLRVDADYDGDRQADEAIYRPGSSVWFIAPSAGGPVQERKLGKPGDFPAPADYDGDGRTDLAVWRPAEAKWLALPSSGGPVIERTTGQDGTPVRPGELDGLLLFARSLAATAQRLSAAGRPGEAVQPARGAIDILLDTVGQTNQAQTLDVVFLVGIYSGHLAPANAIGPVKRAVAIAQQLAAGEPENFDYRYRHAWIRGVLAQRLAAAGREVLAQRPAAA